MLDIVDLKNWIKNNTDRECAMNIVDYTIIDVLEEDYSIYKLSINVFNSILSIYEQNLIDDKRCRSLQQEVDKYIQFIASH